MTSQQKKSNGMSMTRTAAEAPNGSTAFSSNKPELEEPGATDQCGLYCFHPPWLRSLAHPLVYLVCICSAVFCQSMLVSGYTSAVLTTIESRYDLRSSEVGMVISAYDVSSLFAGLFVSYLGGQRHRTRWLGTGALLIALGSVGFSLPHFLGNAYHASPGSNTTSEESRLCNGLGESSVCIDKSPERWAWVTFVVSFLVIGIGASPIYSLGPTYLYDNIKPNKFPVYAGIMYSMGALGPATGFLVGAMFLTLWVEPGDTPPGVIQADSSWVGAWWMGFLLCAGLIVLIAIPLLLFPIKLPNVDRGTSIDERPTFAGYGTQLKEFPRALWKLLKNPRWLFCSLAFVVEQSIGTGFNRYIAKYFQVAFNTTAFMSSILAGCVLIPAAVLGIITGGVLMKRLDLDVPGIAKFILLLYILPCIGIASILALTCDNINLAGVNVNYSDNVSFVSAAIDTQYNVTSPCNVACTCSDSEYDPVCGNDQLTYVSPCHAGCRALTYLASSSENEETVQNYTDCACVSEALSQHGASPGRCTSVGCDNLVLFLVLLFVVVFVTTMGQNPVLLITLRSVDANSRSFALGMQNLLTQLIAFIPAPIYFGQIFDSQCILWSPTCDGTGSCWEYNARELTYLLFGTCLGLKGITFIFLLLTVISTQYVHNRKECYEMDLADSSGSSTSTLSTVAERKDTISTISIHYSPYSINVVV